MNDICKSFRQFLLMSGYVNVRISKKKAPSGRILYGSYFVTADNPVGSRYSKTITQAEMQRCLANLQLLGS